MQLHLWLRTVCRRWRREQRSTSSACWDLFVSSSLASSHPVAESLSAGTTNNTLLLIRLNYIHLQILGTLSIFQVLVLHRWNFSFLDAYIAYFKIKKFQLEATYKKYLCRGSYLLVSYQQFLRRNILLSNFSTVLIYTRMAKSAFLHQGQTLPSRNHV